MISLRESFKFEMSSVQRRACRSDFKLHTCKMNPIGKCEVSSLKLQVSDRKEHMPSALTSNFPPNAPVGGIACETNPISPRRRGRTEGIVQNEAKLGGIGVCGQRRSPCGAWLGRGARRLRIADCKEAGRRRVPETKCAKRTQFRPSAEEVGRGRPSYEEPKRAKRTQFGPARHGESGEKRLTASLQTGEIVRNEPNSGGLAGGWNPQYSTIPSFHHSNPMPIVQNEANFRRRRWDEAAGPAGRDEGKTRRGLTSFGRNQNLLAQRRGGAEIKEPQPSLLPCVPASLRET